MPSDNMLVCVRAGSPLAVAGSVFDRRCSFCGERVMVSLSGQALLRMDPEAKICCSECFVVADGQEVRLAGTCEEMEREAATARLNLWRGRN